MKNRIAEFRKAKRWSQARLAREIHPPTERQQIRNLEERDPRALDMGWLTRLAAALGTTPDELVDLAATENDVEAIQPHPADRRIALDLYPTQCEPEIMRVCSPALRFAGYAEGDCLVLDRTLAREPIPGLPVVAEVRIDGEQSPPHLVLRLYDPPYLVPDGPDRSFKPHLAEGGDARIVAVVVGSYRPTLKRQPAA